MSSSGYRALLQVPAVRWQAAARLLRPGNSGAASVGIILVVRQHTASLTLAGVVVAALWIAAGVSRPLQGRLIDRHGPAEVMTLCGIVHGAALAGIVGFTSLGTPGWALVALGVIAGLSLPPVSTSMRIAWGDLVTPDEQTAAYSLVYLIQELAILIGPLILAVLIGAFSASAALITVAAIAVAGSLAFAASVQIPGDLGSRAPGSGQAVLRVPNMQVLVVVAVLIGGAICAIQVAATAFATAHRAPAAAGVLIAAVSVGGIIGAAIYATGRWRTAPSARLALLLTALTLSLALVTRRT